jgi:hypothetical protein
LIEERIKSVTLKPDPGEVQQPDNIFVGKQGQWHKVNLNTFLNAFKNPNEDPFLLFYGTLQPFHVYPVLPFKILN